MRPDSKYERGKKAGPARARMFLKAHWGWIRGYPIGQGESWVDWAYWESDDDFTGRRVRLDRESLRQVEFGVQKLVHRFPQAFPQVVEDSDHWLARAHRVLDHLKAAIHDGQPLPRFLSEPDSLPLSDRKARTKLQPAAATLPSLCAAFTWMLHFEPSKGAHATEWLRTYESDLRGLFRQFGEEQGIRLALALWMLADSHDAKRIALLLRYLADPAVQEFPLIEKLERFIKRFHDHTLELADPAGKFFAVRLVEFVNWLRKAPAKIQRDSLDLFNIVLPAELVSPWMELWFEFKDLVKLTRSDRLTSEQYPAHRARLMALVETPIAPVGIEEVFDCIRRLSDRKQETLRKQVLRTLPTLPLCDGAWSVRSTMLSQWIWEWGTLGAMQLHLRQLHSFWKHGADPTRLEPFRPLRHGGYYPGIGIWRQETAKTKRIGSDFLEAMHTLCQRGCAAMEFSRSDALEELVDLCGNVEETVASYLSLKNAGLSQEYLPQNLLALANRLSRRGMEFGRCAKVLHQRAAARQTPEDFVSAIVVAEELLSAAGEELVVARLIEQEELSQLEQLGQSAKCFQKLKTPIPTLCGIDDAVVPAWGLRYPPELHTAIGRLSAISPRAESLAHSILDKDFPDPLALHRELAAIEARMQLRPDDSGLAKRRANLEARAKCVAGVSPVRLAYLQRKLELSRDRVLVNRWRQQLHDQLVVAIAQVIQVEKLPEELLEPARMSVLTAVLKLAEPYRGLALRLFRLRCGPRPWNLDNDPANQQYVAKLQSLGINPQPWLGPHADHWFSDSQGRRFRLQIETDPLDVLLMGEHFQTCLSLDGMNFFSAVVNAADINKRVIYARNARGEVVGRCLLALTDKGRLLTFCPYSHDQTIEFHRQVAILAKQLTEAMGTQTTVSGNVPMLLAPRWYDDGPRDLCGQFAFLEDGSSLRLSIAKVSLDSLVETLRSGIHPLPLDEMTLPLIINLRELDERPELILPLLPLLENMAHPPQQLAWRAAKLAYAAGNEDYARRVLNLHVVDALVKSIRRYGSYDVPLLEALAELDPTAALRVLRATRWKGIHDDLQESYAPRRHLLAKAHERLGRLDLAQRLRNDAS